MATRLPGIAEVCYMPAEHIPPYADMAAMAGASVEVFYPVTTIAIEGEAECSASMTNENNGQEETATLSFRTVEELPHDYALAILIRDVNGQWWLLGAREAPGIKLTRERSLGTPSGNAAVITYSAEYSGRRALVRCNLFR